MPLTMINILDHTGVLMSREQLLGAITYHLRKLLIAPKSCTAVTEIDVLELPFFYISRLASQI